MDKVTLPPELEQFAAEAIAAGRYRDEADLVRAGVDLLRRQEVLRTRFVASLDAAIAESERDGFFTTEQVEREMDDIITRAEHAAE